MSEHIDPEELAMYALESLPVADRTEVREHLKGCPECARELAAISGDMAFYSFSAPEYAVPKGAREALAAADLAQRWVAPSRSPRVRC